MLCLPNPRRKWPDGIYISIRWDFGKIDPDALYKVLRSANCKQHVAEKICQMARYCDRYDTRIATGWNGPNPDALRARLAAIGATLETA
jgi:hypothetical protein